MIVSPLRALCLAILLASAGKSLCPGQSISDLSEASLEQLGKIEVYSASKHLQDAREAPSSVTVVTADEIHKHGYRTLADILRSVRDFYVSYDRNYSYVGFRGFGRPGDYNTRVLLLVDGHRINDNIYDQATLSTEFPLDVDLIERVEVIRGPGSSLYGSNAFFAVINVITRKATDLQGWEISFEPGSFQSYKGRASYGGVFNGAEVLLSGSIYDSAGQTLFFPGFDSPSTNHGIANGLDYDRYRDFLLTTRLRQFTLQAVTSWRGKGIPTAAFDTIFNDPRTRSIDQHQYIDLGYQSNWNSWQVGLRTYYDRYGYDGTWPYPGELNFDYVRGQRWGSELQVSRYVAQKHHLTFGSEVRDNLQQDQKNYDVTPAPLVYVDARRTSWIWAGFFQDEYQITRQFTLNAGVRYDGVTEYDGSLSPRLGLIYRPLADTSFKLLYGTAFRTPNVFEKYYGSGAPDGYIPNSNLQSESIRNIELVWEQRVGPHFQFAADLFHSDIADIITLQEGSDIGSGLLVYRNSGRARSTGFSFEVEGHGIHGIEAVLSYTHAGTQDRETGQVLVNSPPNLGKFSLTAPLVRRSLFGSVDVQYEDARHGLSGSHVPPFAIINTTLFGYAFNQHLNIAGSVYNLLDKTYFDVAPAESHQPAMQQDGRSFRLKLTASFGGKH